MPYTAPEEERFWNHVTKTDSCWLWTGGKFSRGFYGCFTLAAARNGSKAIPCHRYSYELHYGQIGPGMVIHHRCRNKMCVNPAHLEQVTLLVHREMHRLTHCKRGHEMAGDNLVYNKKGNGRVRRCKTCWKSRHTISSDKVRDTEPAR